MKQKFKEHITCSMWGKMPFVCMGRWFLMIFAVCFAVAAMFPGVGAASTLSGFHKIMEIRDYPHGDGAPAHMGDVNGVSFTLNGKPLCLVPDVMFNYSRGGHISSGVVRFMSEDKRQEYLSFSVGTCPKFLAYKFQNNDGQEFLLLISGVLGVSDSACRNFWLVGGYGNQYVTFATLDSAVNAGLLYEDIGPSIENGELRITGYARDRSCRTYDPQTGQQRYSFKGHPAYLCGAADCYINWISFFWNSDAQWFGIRRAN